MNPSVQILKMKGFQENKSATTYKPDWELNIVELIEDGETWIIISGQYAKKTTDADTIWIRKDEFDEFKKLINSI